MSRFRAACFTLNNYTPEELESIRGLSEGGLLKYLVYQLEIGESGTPHIQGYAYARDAKSLTAWKSLLSGRAHVERARGSPEQCRDYCTKEDSRQEGSVPFIWGVIPEQGKRTDIDGVFALIKEGKSEQEILETDPSTFIKYTNGIKRAMVLYAPLRSWKTTIFWWHGSTGSGKSREAFERYPDAYWKPPATKWWDGYDGQETVIIDDYRRDLCTFGELLRLFDRYPFYVETKGGTRSFVARQIIVTTPRTPRDTWQGRADEDLGQLMRRIEEVRLFGDLVAPAPIVSTFNPLRI